MNIQLQTIVDSSWDITKSLMPKQHTVYHYTSPQGFLGIMQSGGEAKLFFTQYDSLNDKSEREHAIEIICHVCENCIKDEIFSRDFYELVKGCIEPQKIVFAQPSIKDPGTISPFWDEYDTYLCSFSQNKDSLPMWNYYSKSQHYEGYNIGFYIENKHAEGLSGYKFNIAKIIYTDTEKEELIRNLLISIAKKYADEDIKSNNSWLISWLTDYINDIILAFKKPCFAHEEEVRMILRVPKRYRSNGIDRVSKRQYRENNGYIIPYVEYSFEKGMVYEIHIAPLLEPEIAKRNVYDLLAQRDYSHVRVFLSEIPIRF